MSPVRQVTIREATGADRPALEDCMAELQAFECSIEPNRVPPDAIRGEYIDFLSAECGENDGTILVADRDGRVVGFVCVLCRVKSEEIVEKEPAYAYVTDLVVLESCRGTGIGTALLQAAEARAVARGAWRMRIGVLSANTVAHHLYRTRGYVDSEVILEKRIRP